MKPSKAKATWLNEQHLKMLNRIARLRVITPAQALQLLEPFRGSTVQNSRLRLATLAKHHLLRGELVEPRRGFVSPIFYRLSVKGLQLIGRDKDRSLVVRPPQPVLRYLLFRNDFYTRAMSEGWRVASPQLIHPDDLPAALQIYRTWALTQEQRHLLQLRSSGASAHEMASAERTLSTLPKFLLQTLTFEFLFQVDDKRCPTRLAILAIDDPRRAVAPRPNAYRSRRGTQVDDLPAMLPRHTPFILRDSDTRYDLVRKETYSESRRLKLWRHALHQIYGNDFSPDSTLFTDAWGVRTSYGVASAPPANTPPKDKP